MNDTNDLQNSQVQFKSQKLNISSLDLSPFDKVVEPKDKKVMQETDLDNASIAFFYKHADLRDQFSQIQHRRQWPIYSSHL